MRKSIIFVLGIVVGVGILGFSGNVQLLDDEKNTINIFQSASKSLVFINTKVIQQDWFALDASEVSSGSGSGFVWDKAGHIVTNYHVVGNASSVFVTLSDRTTLRARIIGAEPSKDLAVLKISTSPSKLNPIQVGTSDTLLVGQKVLAIGNPFGLDQTLTTGIVSALGREIASFDNRKIKDVIQTDASINPGNSGGPLIDSSGNLIGVNTSILSPTGTNTGVGFAVPVNTVKRVVPEIIKHGKVIRPGMGISIVRDNIAKNNDIDGIIIATVHQGTGAAKAGMRGIKRNEFGEFILGDVIVEINNFPVHNQNDFFDIMEKFNVGDEVTVKYVRNEKTITTKVVLQRMD